MSALGACLGQQPLLAAHEASVKLLLDCYALAPPRMRPELLGGLSSVLRSHPAGTIGCVR